MKNIYIFNYLNYLDSYVPNFIDFSKNGINTSILTKENEILSIKNFLEKESKENKELFDMENSYYEKLKIQIEQLLQKIRDLQKENDDLKYQIKLKKKNDNTIRAQINFTIKPKKKNKIINEIENIESFHIEKTNIEKFRSAKKIEEELELDDEIIKKKKKFKLVKEKMIQLNLNHKFGKIDQIRKEAIEKQLQKEKEELEELYRLKREKLKYEKPIILDSEMIINDNNKYNQLKTSIRSVKTQNLDIENEFHYVFDDRNIIEAKNNKRQLTESQIKEINKMENLNSKKVSINKKKEVLSTLINNIEKFCEKSKNNNLIYNPKQIQNIKENKIYLKKLFYDLCKNPNLNIDIGDAIALLFEIVNSNYNDNLNYMKLRDKDEYDKEDFEIDLNDEYKDIINKTIKHIKNMYNSKRIDSKFAPEFLAKAILNCEFDDQMYQRIYDIFNDELNKGHIFE